MLHVGSKTLWHLQGTRRDRELWAASGEYICASLWSYSRPQHTSKAASLLGSGNSLFPVTCEVLAFSKLHWVPLSMSFKSSVTLFCLLCRNNPSINMWHPYWIVVQLSLSEAIAVNHLVLGWQQSLRLWFSTYSELWRAHLVHRPSS